MRVLLVDVINARRQNVSVPASVIMRAPYDDKRDDGTHKSDYFGDCRRCMWDHLEDIHGVR